MTPPIDEKFLLELSQKINSQDNRATQYPLFEIRTKKRIYGSKEWCSECERNEDSEGGMCKKCLELWENGEDVPDWCDDCSPECFVWYNLEYVPVDNVGLFFTAEAAQKHIDENSYHYCEPIVYGISAWRNPEMQRIMQIISSLTTQDGKPRDCYK